MVANEISRPMSYIFNLSLQNGVFPAKLKKSRTVPISSRYLRISLDSLCGSVSSVADPEHFRTDP